MSKTVLLAAGVSLLISAMVLFAYHRAVVAPMQRIGVIDVGEVWKLKEKEFSEAVARAGNNEKEREKALEVATVFAKALPAALEQLPQECNCVVLVRTALAAGAPNIIDLTPELKRKLGLAG